MHTPVTIELQREDTTTPETVEVGTLKLANYPAAYEAHSTGDEFRLVEIACGGKPRGWAVMLKPESYDRLVAEVYKANPGFFAYSTRRTITRGVGTIAASVVRGTSG